VIKESQMYSPQPWPCPDMVMIASKMGVSHKYILYGWLQKKCSKHLG
jgi:hypothetical protein